MAAKTAAAMVAAAKQRVQALSPEQAADELAGNALVVDLRDANERDEHGSIPGAVHAPRGMLEFLVDPASPYHRAEFDPNRRVVLHCPAGGRSALAADTLRDLGYTDVAHLDGGFSAWKAAGHPVEETQPAGGA